MGNAHHLFCSCSATTERPNGGTAGVPEHVPAPHPGDGHKLKIDPDMHIFRNKEDSEEGYCIKHLEHIFLRKYPLATRRYNYMNICQPKGMVMSSFTLMLKRKALQNKPDKKLIRLYKSEQSREASNTPIPSTTEILLVISADTCS